MNKKRITIIGVLLLTLVTCLSGSYQCTVSAKETDYQGKAYAFAIDVSGSMKSTDPEHLTYEMLELLIRSCREEDYICITAYNDTIAFDSGVVSCGDQDQIEVLLQQVKEIPYSRDTDNGLGLLTATKHLADMDTELEGKYVFLITDGDTDLPESKTDRTVEDSNRDLEESAVIASESDIMIQAIEFTSSYMQDTTRLSLVTSATGGGTILAKETTEYIQVLLNMFYSTYHKGAMNFQIQEMDELVQRQEFSLNAEELSDFYVILFTEDTFQNAEVFHEDGPIAFIQTPHYVLTKVEESTSDQIKILYSLDHATKMISGVVSSKSPQEIIVETEEPIIETSPKAVDVPQIIPVVPAKEKGIDGKVLGILVAIVIFTIFICIFIIKKVLFPQKEAPRIVGYLSCRFIDLKSKNETKDVTWNLLEQPGAGVTLEELFKSAKVKESLQDLDKICFYPSNKKNELILVHCMEGGVFLGDQLVKQNKQVIIHDQDVIFISFAENASELAIQYSYQEG